MKVRRKRMVILTVETIGELLRDYLGDVIPRDARSLRLEFCPKENGKLALVYEGDSIKPDAKDVIAYFDLKRMYSVGGDNG